MSQVDLFCRVVLGVIFLAAAAGKVRGRGAVRATRTTVRAAFGVPAGPLATGVTVALPVAELAVVALLAVPAAAPAGYLLAAVLLAGFSAGVALALRRGRRVPCRCFGADDVPIGRRHLARNGGLLVLAAAGLAASQADGSAASGLAVDPAAVAAASVGILVAVAVIRMEDLAFLFGSG